MGPFLSNWPYIPHVFWARILHAPPASHGLLSFDASMGKKSTRGRRESRMAVNACFWPRFSKDLKEERRHEPKWFLPPKPPFRHRVFGRLFKGFGRHSPQIGLHGSFPVTGPTWRTWQHALWSTPYLLSTPACLQMLPQLVAHSR
jgi:hypothetical protein